LDIIASGLIITEILLTTKRDSFLYFGILISFITVIVVGPSLLLNDIPDPTILKEIKYVKEVNNGQPIYFWLYWLNPDTRFFPGREVIIVDKTNLNAHINNGQMNYLIARTSDLPELLTLVKPIKTYPEADFTILQLK
jgi:hypothetical protein